MMERLDEVRRRLAGNAPLDASERAELGAELSLLRQELRELETRERVFRDVIRDRNREFEEKVLELSVLKEVGDRIAGSFGVEELLPRVLDVLHGELGVTACSIMRLKPGTDELVLAAGRGPAGPAEPALAAPRPELRAGEGVAGWVAASRQSLIVGDVSRDVRFKRTDGGPSARGSLLCVPLLAADRVLGVMNLSSSSVGFFGPHHVRILRIVASQIASALQGREVTEELRELHERLEEQVLERTRELERRSEDLRRKNDTITDLYFSLEEAQRELEARNREVVRALAFNDNIVETVHVGIGVVDERRRVVTWNRALETISGGLLTKEKVLGRPLEDIPRDVRELFGLGRPLLDALQHGRPATLCDHAVELPDGTRAHLNVHLLPVSIGGDGHGQVILVVEDVTAQVDLLEQRVKAERLAAITATAVSVNHEVNNPLAVILGYAQMLLERLEREPDPPPGTARLRRDLARIEGEALRIRDITAEMAALIEPVVTSYPVPEGPPMVDLARSRTGTPGSGSEGAAPTADPIAPGPGEDAAPREEDAAGARISGRSAG